MARIDFAFGAKDRAEQACMTTYRQFQAGQRVLIVSTRTEMLRQLDALLWARDDTSFIPHVWADDPLASETAVVLAGPAHLEDCIANAPASTWLLNLDDTCPTSLGQMERVLEIVSDDPEDKDLARARWRQYQAAGHTLKAHALMASADDRL